MQYQYRVTRQYLRGVERPLSEEEGGDPFAEFKDLPDAEMFIESKLQKDSAMNIKVVYRLFDNLKMEMIRAYSAADFAANGAGGQSATSGFRPTPFNTAPTPRGLPKKWLKTDEDEEEDKKK